MQTAITNALESLQTKVGDVDDYVADKLKMKKADVVGTADKPGRFSAEQIDAIAMALGNLDKDAGFILGDQTGVGKGRVVAAMIHYAKQQGKVPIFVTKSPALYEDMYRDLRDIGMKNFNALVTNTDLRGSKAIPIGEGETLTSLPPAQLTAALTMMERTGRLPKGYDALFTTYSQMQYAAKGADTARHEPLRQLAPNAMLILDESHEAGGTAGRPRGEVDPVTKQWVIIPRRSDFIRQLVGDADSVVYSSATFAKNPHVMSLYSRTDMPLAVGGDVNMLAGVIEAGGIPMQQVASNMLIEAGQYARRERSYAGVDMPMKTVEANKVTAENVSRILRETFHFDRQMKGVREAFGEDLHDQGGDVADDNAVGDTGITSVQFSSIMHNVIGQSLLALKAQHAVNEAIEAWKNGEKPIIAMSNTFGALLDRYVEEEGLKIGDTVDKQFPSTGSTAVEKPYEGGFKFNRVFDNYLNRTREVTIKDPHDRDNDQKYYITDADLKRLGFGYLIDEFKTVRKTIAGADLASMPPSPLDYMLSEMRKAGMKVGEITGRQLILQDGRLTKRNATDAAKKRVMNEFNNGELDALLINRSGSTGFSLHASQHYKDFDDN